MDINDLEHKKVDPNRPKFHVFSLNKHFELIFETFVKKVCVSMGIEPSTYPCVQGPFPTTLSYMSTYMGIRPL